ncbi:uncharacterized protein [Diadema setosum]|uniref:uncharacterized protein n=1 Tax=Diadema setosum TaxID=31175 RepID=UPI003B3B2F96
MFMVAKQPSPAMADGGLGTSSSRLCNKKSFEYKMSKKVAELTQVVHMLFSRNHEREVELEATKEAYEQEVSNVVADAKKRIEGLEQCLANEKKQAEADHARAMSDYDKKLQEQKKESDKLLLEVRDKNGKLVAEIGELKGTIVKLEEEVKRTKDQALKTHFSSKRQTADHSSYEDDKQDSRSQLLDSSPSVMANKGSVSPRLDGTADIAHINQLKEDLKVKEIETENLKHMVAMHVQTQRDNDAALVQLKKDLEKSESELKVRISQLIEDVTLANKAKEKAQQKNKTLETDLKSLKKSLERKRDAGNETKRRSNDVKTPRSSKAPSEVGSDAYEEVERLKREIRWYRMELSNREGNFNRMFAESNPIRLGGMATGPNLAPTRQRTDIPMKLPAGALTSRSDDVRSRAMSPPNRLPTLGMDGRQRDSTRTKYGHNSEGGKAKVSTVAREKHTPRGITSGYT